MAMKNPNPVVGTPPNLDEEQSKAVWRKHLTLDAAPDEAAVETAAVDMVREARAATQVVTNAELDDVARIGQLVGVARHSQFMENTNRVIWLKTMHRLKETGEYKNLPMENTQGEMVRPKNFAELCAAMGTSRSKVDEDLQNLFTFGGVVLEGQKKLGISYPELRALRAGIATLPEAEQAETRDRLTQAVESGDKSAVRELLEDLVEEKKVLAKKLSDAKKVAKEAQEQADVLKRQRDEKSQRANELEMRLELTLNPANEDDRQKALAEARDAFRTEFEKRYRAIIANAGALCIHAVNAKNIERCPDLMDAALREYVDNRISQMCQELRGFILNAGLEVDFAAEFDLDGFTGMRGEPDDFTPETNEPQ